MKTIVFVMGATCSGKTTLIEKADEYFADTATTLCVGKILRKKHPPEYFEGSGAPEKTTQDVLDIFDKGVSDFKDSTYSMLLVDGMPRQDCQIQRVAELESHFHIVFVYLYCPDKERELRLSERFKKGTSGHDLGLARMQSDKAMYLDVICRINLYTCWTVDYIDVSFSPELAQDIFQCLLEDSLFEGKRCQE